MHTPFRRLRPHRWAEPAAAWLPAALVAYFVLLGGTDIAVTNTLLRAVNALIGGALIVLWLRRMPADNDLFDRLALLALLAFLLAGVFSRYPRQSYDACLAATAFTATVYLARRALADATARANVVLVLATIGVGMGIAFAAVWMGAWLEWGALTGFAGWPPVDLPLPRGPYRHPHVVGMLLALLLPAVVVAARTRAGGRWSGVAAVAGPLPMLLVIFMSGSRTVWLAGVLAAGVSLLLVVRRRGIPRPLRRPGPAAAVAIFAAAALAVLWWSGLADAFVARVTDVATLGGRARLWGAALDAWRSSPLTGVGPGTFPIELSQLGFYDQTGFTPRHADNAGIQLLAEAGLLGAAGLAAAAAGFLGITFGSAARPSAAAVAAVTFAALASVTDNPTDTANLVVLTLVWAAVATPWQSGAREARRTGEAPIARWTRRATWTAGALVAVGTLSTLLAAGAFDAARGRLAAGDAMASIRALDAAVALDPGMALYRRDRGVLHLLLGDAPAAELDLGAARRLNPSDDTALRGLAIAAAKASRHEEAVAWAREAMRLQRSDPANLLLLAWTAARAGDTEASEEALGLVVEQTPWITAAPDWSDPFPSGEALRDLLERTAERWGERGAGVALTELQPSWLVGLSGRRDLQAHAREHAGALDGTADALAAIFACDPGAAVAALEAAFPEEAHSRPYWMARLLVSRLAAERDRDETLVLARLRAPGVASAATGTPGPLPPLSDGHQDYRFYRREALPGVDLGVRLPSPGQGLAAWLDDPRSAAARGAPGGALSECP